ncbi:unnamed protein product [Pseudo-nitzschia multistriata]|uniref:Uncharacterized protein n=1 Tax=Pseudo-nitzschia multistriata TaxID=183589 RepID=A0A448ZIN5_9STRA|nr:unnamed protein product [Pseudo-nitzschia multistriata]
MQFKGGRKVIHGGVVNSGNHNNGGTDELDLEGAFDIGFLLDGPDVSSDKGAHQADKDSDSRDNDGEDHGIPSSRQTNAASNDQGSTGGFSEGSKQIGSHTSDISDVVTNIIGNGGGVARIVLGDSVNNLSNQIGTNVGGLGVDSSSNTPEHGNDGSSQSVSGERFGEQDPFFGIGVVRFEE